MPIPLIPTSSRDPGDLSDEELVSTKSRGRSFSRLFSRKKSRAAKANTSAQAARSLDGRRPPSTGPSRSSSPRSESRGRSISPNFLTRKLSRDSSNRSPSPVRGVPGGGTTTDEEGQDGMTPTHNAFDDTDEEGDGEYQEEEEEDEGSDNEEYEPVTDDEIELFRNTSINTGDRPVMNILQSQSQLPEVEDDHPNMLPGEKEVFFVPSDDQPLETLFNKTRKQLRPKKALPLHITDPLYERNRCTITLENGNPSNTVNKARRKRRYLVACDLSEESVYAIEWAIGTVLRDGDQAIVVSVIETDTKFDPDPRSGKGQELTTKERVKIQKDRKERADTLAGSVKSLLRRTRLNVEISCQAIHARNARHMLVDMIDYIGPTLVIVGSRGLTKIKGILLGSVSYYLVQKSSVPVMVARRRLRQQIKPHKQLSQLDRHARVPLSHAETEMESHAAEVHSSSDPSDSDDDEDRQTAAGDLSDKASEKLPSRANSDDDASMSSETEDELEENQATLTDAPSKRDLTDFNHRHEAKDSGSSEPTVSGGLPAQTIPTESNGENR